MKKYLRPFKSVAIHFYRLFIYRHKEHDNADYWKGRAKEEGEKAVLWTNQTYNDCFRADQRTILEPYIKALKPGARVLDIGCGIGVVSQMMLEINPHIIIDAVDFQEMVDIAKSRIQDDRINLIASSADEYKAPENTYDFIMSSGCFSAIRLIEKMLKAVDGCSKLLKPQGQMLLIDPLHRWSYLARVKFNSNQMIDFLKTKNLSLECQSGVLFWPFRLFLANSTMSSHKVSQFYAFGEMLGTLIGKHFWADYKILVFRKK